MNRSILFTFLLVSISSASLAQAEYIGVWRWLGMGWGPGYHSGASKHHGHYQPGQPMAPAWGEPWQEAPAAAQPELAPLPEALAPMPDAGAWRGKLSPAQQAVLQRESQRRSAMAPANSAAPSFKSYFESSR